MIVKIGVIFIPFSNTTCCFRDTTDFTHGKSGGYLPWVKLAVSLKQQVEFEIGMKMDNALSQAVYPGLEH